MRRIFLVLFSIFLACTARAELISIQTTPPDGEPWVTEGSTHYIPSSTFTANVAAGIGRAVRLEILDLDGNRLITRNVGQVSASDYFTHNGVQYYGPVIEIDSTLPDGFYVLNAIVLDGTLRISERSYNLVIDSQPPELSGDFFWDNDSSVGHYYGVHTDGKFIVSRAAAKAGGFNGLSYGPSGVAQAFFSAEFIDGDRAGQLHANAIEANFSANSVYIGTGARNSIGSNHLPSNTHGQMRFTFTVTSRSGLSTSRYADVYVATRPTQQSPEPYAVFTGTHLALDGIPAFTGFTQYEPGMAVTSNPVRMIYRADRTQYYGGGGDAQIYGGWIGGARNDSHVVHLDDNYIYFDISGTTNGQRIEVPHVRDFATWRRFFFEHDLTLGEDAVPPKATNLDFYIEGLDEWRFSTGTSNTSEITKHQTGGEDDRISKIRVRVEPRVYEQRFSYSFSGGYSGNCFIAPGDEECILDVDLPYPGTDIQTYHNRHRILAVGSGMTSDEMVFNWLYDGMPAEVVEGSINYDANNQTIDVSVIKPHLNRIWARAQIRHAELRANNTETGNTITIPHATRTVREEGGSGVWDLSFNLDTLPDGSYELYLYVEDGFTNPDIRHKLTHHLVSLENIDTTPPVITSNIEGLLHTLQAITVSIQDASPIENVFAYISGGPQGVNVGVPMIRTGLNQYRPEHTLLHFSETDPYDITVVATDAAGNAGTYTNTFIYQPRIQAIPDRTILAINAAITSEEGKALNTLQTPIIRNQHGLPAKGNHDVYFSLMEDAPGSLVVNGSEIMPGQTIHFKTNLSATNHRVRLNIHPTETGVEDTYELQMHFPHVNVAICPADFAEQGDRCVFVDFAPKERHCNDPFQLDGNTCRYEFSYIPEPACTDGYTRNDTLCSGTLTAAPQPICPLGYGLNSEGLCERHSTAKASYCHPYHELEDGMCVDTNGAFHPTSTICLGQEIPDAGLCEDGTCIHYRHEWSACEVIETTEPSLQCEFGTLTGGQCSQPHSYDLNMQCPFGYTRDDIYCRRLEIIPPNTTCPDGYEQSAGACLRVEYSPFIGCPDGYRFEGKRCHPLQSIIIECPDGFLWDGTQCARTETQPISLTCTAGYDPHNPSGECRRTETQAANFSCPTGYTPHTASGECRRTETQAANFSCPTGYTPHTASGQCRRTETQAANINCPSGYSFHSGSGQCRRTQTQAANINCPSGYSFHNGSGQCRRTQTQTANINCPSGYSFHSGSGQCRRTQTQSSTVNYSCPNGGVRSGSTCTQTIAASKTCFQEHLVHTWNGHTRYSLPIPETADVSGYCHYSSIQTCANYWQCDAITEGVGSFPNTWSYTCPTGYTRSGSSCSRSYTATISYSCPSGWSRSGTTCSRTQTASPSYSCPSGWSRSGTTCSRTQTASPSYSCPSGWSRSGATCSRTQTASPTYSCPNSSWTRAGTTCSRVVTTSPTSYSCPNSSWTLSGTECNRVVTTAPTSYSCPNNSWTLTGTICSRVVTSTPLSYCADGWSYNGSNCTRVIFEVETRTCPSGTQQHNHEQCFLLEPESYVGQCSGGWTAIETQCTRTLTDEIILYCNDTHELINDQCHRTLEELVQVTCQSSEDYEDGSCVRHKSTPVIRMCSAPFSRYDNNNCRYRVEIDNFDQF